MINMPLSVLRLAIIEADSGVADTLRETTVFAQQVEAMGTGHCGESSITLRLGSVPSRLWCSSPIPPSTSSIRVGSGGVLAPNHSPILEAEQFTTLAGLRPERIDLDRTSPAPSGRTTWTGPRIARLGRHRWTIERSIAWLFGYRGPTFRYEGKGSHVLRLPDTGPVEGGEPGDGDRSATRVRRTVLGAGRQRTARLRMLSGNLRSPS